MSFWSWLGRLFGGGGRPPAPQPQPKLRPIVVWAVPGAEVRLESPQGTFIARTDEQGVASFPAMPDGHVMPAANLFIEKPGKRGEGVPGYAWYGEVITMPADADAHQFFAIPGVNLQVPFQVQLPVVLKSLRPFPAEHGFIRRDKGVFSDEANALWQFRNHTDFLLFFRFLLGENIQPILDDRIAAGFNVLRVLGMVAWERTNNQFFPQKWPNYAERLAAFVDLLAASGLRVEFVPFADAQIVMPKENEQDAYAAMVVATIGHKWNVFIEWANEPFKNIPGGAARVSAIGKRFAGTVPVLMASGAGVGDIAEGDFAQLAKWTLQYCTIHDHSRGSEWPRKMKDALEVRWGLEKEGLETVVIMDEPIGADETNQPGRRSNVPADFEDGAAVLALQTPGACGHTQAGLDSLLLPPVTKACMQAWIGAMKTIGPEWQTGQYTAGHLSTCPLEHSDDLALRTFAQILGNRAFVVVVRPKSNWRPIPKGGWRIERIHGTRGQWLEMVR